MHTVYPARPGGFPPASFRSVADALAYMREMQDTGAPCGLCICPAASFWMHYPLTPLS